LAIELAAARATFVLAALRALHSGRAPHRQRDWQTIEEELLVP
jgi:hypothetical protein